jgi:shikimate kinase
VAVSKIPETGAFFSWAYTAGMNIVLIGYRGSGKTSVGRKLAQKLWLEFVDTDALIEQRTGKSIRELFEKEGEAGFREYEAAVIREVTARDQLVIAVGGGAVTRPENVEALKKTGRIIWLRAQAETMHARIEADVARGLVRPNLTHDGGLEEVRRLSESREGLYQSAADVTLEVTHLSVDEAAMRLISMV